MFNEMLEELLTLDAGGRDGGDSPADPVDGMADTATRVHCPYCGEPCELLLDPGGGVEQRYVEDCEVCCRPWNVHVRWDGGHASVQVSTEDEAPVPGW